MQKGTYLITGISGYIGSLLAKTLMDTAEYKRGEINIIGVARNYEKAATVFSACDCSFLNIIEMDILSLNSNEDEIEEDIDYIIHCAASTTSSYMISNPVETADGIVLGTRNVLELARRKKVRSIVYLSSMEVYGTVDDTGAARSESELGEVSLEAVRSCYPLGKRMAEHYCHIYFKEYGVPVKIARLAQTFGVSVRPEDNRVYMQFARAAFEKKDIVLKTKGFSIGNYCAADDAVCAILLIQEKGIDGEVYNVVNEENTMSVYNMACLVAKEIANDEIAVRIEVEDRSKTGYAQDTGLRLSGGKIRQLGWQPTKNLVQMYTDVLEEISKRK